MGENIKINQISEVILHYPDSNYIGAYGKSKMKPMKGGASRDFGIYRKAKIRIKPINHSGNEILVKGRLFIYGVIKEDFKGKIIVSDIERYYTLKSRLDERGNIVQDSILKNKIKSKFKFFIKNNHEYNGELTFSIKKNRFDKWLIEKSGIELYGEYNNSNLTFGHITPRSYGIFRFKNDSKMCINKNLLKYGWESYLYSHPEYFNCIFESYSDKITPIHFTEKIIKKN